MAYIVRKPGCHVSTKELLKHMAERTAKIKHITGGIIFCNMIPKNPVRDGHCYGHQFKPNTMLVGQNFTTIASRTSSCRIKETNVSRTIKEC